jgi:hypothetical protein
MKEIYFTNDIILELLMDFNMKGDVLSRAILHLERKSRALSQQKSSKATSQTINGIDFTSFLSVYAMHAKLAVPQESGGQGSIGSERLWIPTLDGVWIEVSNIAINKFIE